MRQDPEGIIGGKIPYKETAQLAIQTALTWHLVFSTLHTNSAVGAIPRLVDMGIDPYLIAPTLIMVMAQRLARRTCPTSKHALPEDEANKQMIEKQFADLAPEYKAKLGLTGPMYEAVPSSECPSGTRGRIPVFEMFMVDKDMQSVILKNPIESEVYRVARSKGMITMREDAIIKNLKGDLPFQEIYTL